MSNLSSDSDRDQRQRAFGFIGFSAMAHVGLLALLAILPQTQNHPQELTTFGSPSGLAGSDPAYVDMHLPGSSDVAASKGNGGDGSTNDAPKEVLLASSNDPNAVALPAKNPTQTEAPIEVKPEPVAVVQPPQQLPPAKPKVVKTVASPKTKTKSAKEPVREDDTAIRTALKASREEPQTDTSAEALPVPMRIAEKAPAQPLEDTAIEETQETIETTTEEQPAPAIAPVIVESKEIKEERIQERVIEQPQAQTLAAVPTRAEEPTQHTEARPQAPPPAAYFAQRTQQAPTAAQPTQSAGHQGPGGVPGHPLAVERAGAPQQNGALRPNPQAVGGLGAGSRPGAGLGFGIPLGAQIRDARELTARPGNPQPIYPEDDRLNRREGMNVIVGRVRPDGLIAEVFLEKSSGSPQMDREALKAFRQWKFMPGQAGYIRQPFQFQLTGEAKQIKGQLRR